MSKSSMNVRAALDEARLNELLRKAQDSFLEIKADREALAKEAHRLALLDAVLAERKADLNQREAAIKKHEEGLAEREIRVQREEADLKSQASFLSKLKAARDGAERRAHEPADKHSPARSQEPAPTSAPISLPTSRAPLAHSVQSAKPEAPLLTALFAKPAVGQPIKLPLPPPKLAPLPPLSRLPPLNQPQANQPQANGIKPLG